MDNTSLFNFEFVDRYKERKIFSKYVTSKETQEILWVTGKRGMGKTRFVKQMLFELTSYRIIWLDNSIQNAKENLIDSLLRELQKVSGYNFYDFIKNNYQLFLDTSKNVLNTILSDKNAFYAHLSDMFFNATSKIVDKQNNSQEIYQIFISYIDRISEQDPLFIIIDNFSRCDKSTTEFLLYLIRNYVNHDNIKFCIITTDEDMEINNELETKIFANIPFTNINIKEFPSYIFFGEILRKIFGDILFNYEDIKYIHDKCGGNPENLIKILKKGLKRNAIQFLNGSPSINKEMMYIILRSENTNFSLKDFTFKEQLLLLVMVCIGKRVNVEFLKAVLDYLLEKIFIYRQFTEEVFFDTLGQLINNNIIVCDIDNELIFEHDSTFLDISDILNELKLKPQICFYLYEFHLRNNLAIYGYTMDECEYYKAYYAAEAGVKGWEQINFNYATSLIQRKLYHEAAIIFDKITTTFFIKSPESMFTIAYTYYEDGQYEKSKTFLNTLILDDKRDAFFLFRYYFFLGKNENILTEKDKSIEHFKKALSIVEANSSEYVEILNLMHLTYMEIGNGRNNARTIFEYVKDNYELNRPYEWAKTMRGIANFYDGDEALSVLQKALKIVTDYNDNIEIAYIQNSIGFILLRNGNLREAKKHFSNAYELLEKHKTHEISYALNNRAICYMLEADYENALTDLLKALLWNATPYAYYTINCHLCTCYQLMQQKEEALKIMSMLEQYLLSNVIEDFVVSRKIRMTLGITYYHMKETMIGDTFFGSLELKDMSNTSSEFRYRFYTNQLDNYNNKNDNIYYTIKTFEPWILIYGHD